LPQMAPHEVYYEAELAVVIKEAAWRVPEKDALRYVLGYTCANDAGARDCQKKDGQWARGKSFETFAPLGPWIETELDPNDCVIKSRLNGESMQNAHTSLMLFGIPAIISYLSQGMTLLPGTVIMTGNPGRCDPNMQNPIRLRPGDVVEVEIEGIGILKTPVDADQRP
jgi:2-keto-4-pentenoate hydratase/2-oxohepta-3-ene-1,7-dioic acid hydratase in catechol pathway